MQPARVDLQALVRTIEDRVARRCAEIAQAQQAEPECPERASYIADAIRKEFGLKGP